ncbi:RNA polymerase sigma factor [Gemmatimonadota bacterium]
MRVDTPTFTSVPDRALAELAIRNGNESAFRALYTRHNPAVLNFVIRRLDGDRSDAEDIVQDAWVRAIGTLDRFRWESSFRSWLTGIALNRLRDLARSRKRRARQSSKEWVAPRRFEDVPARLDLERAIGQLAERPRAVLLRHAEGFSHKEIGDLLGIPEGTSKSDLHRARGAVRTLVSA